MLWVCTKEFSTLDIALHTFLKWNPMKCVAYLLPESPYESMHNRQTVWTDHLKQFSLPIEDVYLYVWLVFDYYNFVLYIVSLFLHALIKLTSLNINESTCIMISSVPKRWISSYKFVLLSQSLESKYLRALANLWL